MILFCPKCQKNVLAQAESALVKKILAEEFKKAKDAIESVYKEVGIEKLAPRAIRELKNSWPEWKIVGYSCPKCGITLWKEEENDRGTI
jgi:uncharacterized Zn finger protein (UPF0148 family)